MIFPLFRVQPITIFGDREDFNPMVRCCSNSCFPGRGGGRCLFPCLVLFSVVISHAVAIMLWFHLPFLILFCFLHFFCSREAVENCNKFRRKCNSFFVEFVSSYCFGGRIPLPAKVIEQLIKFVACKPANSEHPESRCGKSNLSSPTHSTIRGMILENPSSKINVGSFLFAFGVEAFAFHFC